MGKLVASDFLTVNGVMEAPERWSGEYWNDEAAQYKHEELFAADALLMGRVTYEIFAEAWPSRTDPEGYADRMNGLPKFVVSTSLGEVGWSNSSLIKDPSPDQIAGLKGQFDRDILLFGSEQLLYSLIPEGLIDEYRLMVSPIVLGSGKRLFRDGIETLTLSVRGVKTTETGVSILTYLPAEA